MRTAITAALTLTLFGAAAFAQKKDTVVVETPDGSKIEIKVPNDLKVKEVGPNHYEIKRNDPALKNIEIKVTPPKSK